MRFLRVGFLFATAMSVATSALGAAGAITPNVSPLTVRLGLVGVGEATGSGVTLSAGAGNGIIAQDDGGAWPGVADVELPWP